MCLQSPSNFKGTIQRFSADLLFVLFQGLKGLHRSGDDWWLRVWIFCAVPGEVWSQLREHKM